MQDLNGDSYLKVQGSSPLIAKLVCKRCNKAFSLANSHHLAELKKQRNKQLISANTDENDAQDKKKRAEQVVDVQVGSVTVQILCPGKRATSGDLMVKIQEDQLAAVFDYLQADCSSKDVSKRAYKRSGRFAKG